VLRVKFGAVGVVVRFAMAGAPRPAPTGVCRGAGVTVRVHRSAMTLP